jgi:predicted acetyltransferase
MITKANERQTEEIREIWRICFPQEDPRYAEYYFKNLYQPENCYVYLLEDKVVSCVIRNTHAVMFNGRALQASMIVGAATLPEYRQRGYMRALLNIVVDACEHSELITLIQSEEPSLYTNFGFRMIYKRVQYTLTRADCKRTTNFGCGYNPTAIDLLKVYSAFISRFNGYYARDLEYFVKYINEIRAQGGKIVAYFNGKDQIQGYASMIPVGNELLVEELIYLDSMALTKLINAALQEKKIVKVSVSEAEDLSRIFPSAPKKVYGSTMMRLNDAELFTKLFGKKIVTVEDVAKISQRPLNLNENA